MEDWLRSVRKSRRRLPDANSHCNLISLAPLPENVCLALISEKQAVSRVWGQRRCCNEVTHDLGISKVTR